MKSLMKNVRTLNFQDLLKINGGYSGSSGGGGSSYGSSKSSSSSGSSTSSSSSCYSSSYSGSSGGSGSSSGTSRTSSSGYSSSFGGSSGSYSAGSGGSVAGSTYSAASGSSYSASGGVYHYNDTRYYYLPNGMTYSSSTGFYYNKAAYSAPSGGTIQNEPITASSFVNKEGKVINGIVNRYNQLDFSYLDNPNLIDKDGKQISFGKNACAATSLLNELSEIYTFETGQKASWLMMESAMEQAYSDKAVGEDATTNFITGANSMAKQFGLEGYFVETNAENADCHIIGVDKYKEGKYDGKVDHFYSTIGKDYYYDPYYGTTGLISDLAKEHHIVREVYLAYKK